MFPCCCFRWWCYELWLSFCCLFMYASFRCQKPANHRLLSVSLFLSLFFFARNAFASLYVYLSKTSRYAWSKQLSISLTHTHLLLWSIAIRGLPIYGTCLCIGSTLTSHHHVMAQVCVSVSLLNVFSDFISNLFGIFFSACVLSAFVRFPCSAWNAEIMNESN